MKLIPLHDRINPDMSNQIADGIHNLDINGQAKSYSDPTPHLSPFPKLTNPPPNVPPSDDELETRLENARQPVLNSNDPEMQLAWAQDALVYCGVAADEAERVAALKPHQARASTPRIEHQLRSDAMNIVTFLADQHHPRAEFLRGMWLEWGRYGQREDKKEAFRCYSRAADRGYARAEYRIGMLYESYNDPIKALRHYHRGVDAGDAASCYRLGMMTLRGQHGQPQDFAKGVELIKKSAEASDENAAQGAYVYGMLLARQLPQIDVPETHLEFNESLAKQNIEKAAYMKFAKAQAKMGSCYELGSLGCEFSPALSIHYNALASRQGEADADMALSKWFLVGSEGLFPKNEELAYTYAERAAATGLPTAEFALGYFHEIGMHVPVNLEKASEWYQKAAKHGNADAQGRLESLANKQVLSRTDHENIAISRIKSQHGSMRGQRPERFQQKQQPRMGTVVESPSNDSGMLPPRGSSRTPYPEDNGPPRVEQRPASVAPYPLGDGPPSNLSSPHIGSSGGPVGGFFNGQAPPRPATTAYPQDVRPSSAFQLNPDLRPGSAAPASGPYPGQRPYPTGADSSGGPGGPGLRQPPYDQRQSSAPQYNFDGRPLNSRDPRNRPGLGGRVASGPPGMQEFRPQSGPPGSGVAHQTTAPVSLGYSSNPASPRVDVGFQAPYEERKPVVDPTWREKQPRRGRRSGEHPNDAQLPGPRPPYDSRKPTPSGAGQYPTPPPKEHTPPPPKPSAAAAKPPPPKGPKTFDEMGVPAQNKKEDCVVM